MTVGTQVKRREMPITATRQRTRKWFAAAAIAVAAIGTGTGIFVAVSGNDAPAGIPVVSSPEVPYVDPGVDARQDALKRFHSDARPATSGSSFQDALKRYHQDAKG